MLVMIGAPFHGLQANHCRAMDEWGHKDVPGLIDGFRESTQSWRELLLDLKRRKLEAAPKLAVGDGAMGFWAALHEVTARSGCSAAGYLLCQGSCPLLYFSSISQVGGIGR